MGSSGLTSEARTQAVCGDKAKRRILFLRHGEGQHQKQSNVVDPLLTDLGRRQAEAWAARIGGLRADLVLVSPLRRAVETACLAFQREEIPFHIQRQARERWWKNAENTFGETEDLMRLLEHYGRQVSLGNVKATHGIHEFLKTQDPPSEEESLAELYNVLAQREETTIVVVCHWGVINALTRHSASNCELVLCKFAETGGLEVIHGFWPPGSFKYAYVEAIQDSRDDGRYYKVGDKGFCTEDNTEEERVTVRFDKGQTYNVPRNRLRTILALGDRVRLLRDSSHNGKWYKKGDTGEFLGYLRSQWRARVQLDSGKVEHPSQPGNTLEKIQVVEGSPSTDIRQGGLDTFKGSCL